MNSTFSVMLHSKNPAMRTRPSNVPLIGDAAPAQAAPAQAAPAQAEALQSNVVEGQLAPDFSIVQLDDTLFKLSDYKGKKPVYLVFWNTWCAFCITKVPKIKNFESELANDIKVIAINTSRQDSVEESRHFSQKYETNYALAFDHDESITRLYGVRGTPTEFIIDVNGIVRHRDGIPDKLNPHLAIWSAVTPVAQ